MALSCSCKVTCLWIRLKYSHNHNSQLTQIVLQCTPGHCCQCWEHSYGSRGSLFNFLNSIFYASTLCTLFAGIQLTITRQIASNNDMHDKDGTSIWSRSTKWRCWIVETSCWGQRTTSSGEKDAKAHATVAAFGPMIVRLKEPTHSPKTLWQERSFTSWVLRDITWGMGDIEGQLSSFQQRESVTVEEWAGGYVESI